MITHKTVNDVTMPLVNMGYEVRTHRPPGAPEHLWEVYSETGRIFSGTFREFLEFRLSELDEHYVKQEH